MGILLQTDNIIHQQSTAEAESVQTHKLYIFVSLHNQISMNHT